jgi:hypothetical protein
MIASLPLAVLLSVVFTGSGALALACAPAPARPLVALAQPAMSASMLAMTWTRPGALALSWPAILLTATATATAGVVAVQGRVARALPAAASVWMLVAMPGPVATVVLCSVLLGTALFWTRRARVEPVDAGCHTLMCLGMAAMLLAQNA